VGKKNVLIVFTPRSGSTIAGELLAHKYSSLFLDELYSGDLRSIFGSRLPADVKNKLGEKNVRRMMFNIAHNAMVWDDTKAFVDTALSLIKDINKDYPIVIKFYPNYVLPGKKLVEWCIDNNFEIYFLRRKDFIEQAYSLLLTVVKQDFNMKARQAGKLQDLPRDAEVVNLNTASRVVFPPMPLSIDIATRKIVTLAGINQCFANYVEHYGKYGKVLSYEDTIRKNDFSEFGISTLLVNDYNNQRLSIRPTHEYKIGHQISNWPEIVEMIDYFNV